MRVIVDADRRATEAPFDVNLWEAHAGGAGPRAVKAPVDPADTASIRSTYL